MNNELIVLKIGTSTLEKQNNQRSVTLDHTSFDQIAAQASSLMDNGAAVAIVSSGAIAAGYEKTSQTRSNDDTVELQRLAMLGQTSLMRAWEDAFSSRSRLVGQALFTRNELSTSESGELAHVSRRVIEHGDIIIANENDALSHEEISFGDNDRLAAHFATLLHRLDLFSRTRLVILSDIHGVYRDINDSSSVIKEINTIADYQEIAGGAGTQGGTGGMATKFLAADIATNAGIDTYITHGRTRNTIRRALSGEIGTRFTAN